MNDLVKLEEIEAKTLEKERAAENARNAEIKRQQEEKKALELEIQKREADKAHMEAVESLIIQQLEAVGIPSECAASVVNQAKLGIKGLKIIY